MIETENRGPITLVRLARGKGNALNLDLLQSLDDMLITAERSEASGVVITGQGSVFGAGVDLPELVGGGEAYIRRFIPLLVQVFKRMALFPKPLVAAVNGHAIAGGAILMLAADQRLLAQGAARIGLTEVQVGVQFPSWALEIARFATPPQYFPTLICTGRTWLPEEALSRGLVDELIAPEQLLDRAFEVANELASLLPAAFTESKLAVRRPLIEAATKSEPGDAAITDFWCSAEVLEQMTAFVQRTIKRKA